MNLHFPDGTGQWVRNSVTFVVTVYTHTSRTLMTTTGLEIKKKSLGRLLASNWRNLVARCKFLVASLYNQKNVNFGAG